MAGDSAKSSSARLRELPSVEAVAAPLRADGVPAHWAVTAAREAVETWRQRLLSAGEAEEVTLDAVLRLAEARANRLSRSNLRRVINATGVVLHTNLGRAPLGEEAVAALDSVARGYSNLEYDLSSGSRGTRFSHVDRLLSALGGAEASHAVNNNAAAVVLSLAALATGGEVVISRGELIEIGGSFRIPEMLELSGARLVEVGTTNRTRLADYERAIGTGTAAILRVHQSNFRAVGFTAQVGIEELARLARARGVRLIDDLGSGALTPLGDEPQLGDSVAAGADLVCCSADKLLGGPQAGLLCGRADAVELCRRHPLARVVRLDKLQIAALEATLRVHLEGRREDLPVEAMLRADGEDLRRRATAMVTAIGPAAEVRSGVSLPGGGALPLLELEGAVCAVEPGPGGADALAATLRDGDPPVVARIVERRLLLDPRTMSDGEARTAATLVAAALSAADV